MGGYNDLKTAITALIRANNNQEITGATLQSVLLSIINTIGQGSVFKGVATASTNPGSPDADVFYIAGRPGYYPNFNLELTAGLHVIENKSGAWVNTEIVLDVVDAINIGGAKHVKPSQAMLINLQSVEQIPDSEGRANKMWWSTDGNLKYRHNDVVYNLGAPAYVLYYCGDKIYKWTGSGFREMGSGGTFASGEAVSNMSIFDDSSDTNGKSSAQLAAMIPSGEVIRSLLDIISSIDTSGGSYDGIDLITTFSYDAPTRVITVKQSGRQAKTILLPLANSTNAGLMSSEDKTQLANMQNLIGKTVNSFSKSTDETGITITLVTSNNTPYAVLIPIDSVLSNESGSNLVTGAAIYNFLISGFAYLDYDNQVYAPYTRLLPLVSMGSVLDNGNTPAQINTNEFRYDPTTKRIYRHNDSVQPYFLPNTKQIYLNICTGKIYKWVGSNMEEINSGGVDPNNYYTKQQVDNAISQMEATIEQQQLTVITGGQLSLWLDEDGESINIVAGEIPDMAAAPTISHVINNDGTATVTIVNNEQGATIYYTTDGTAPTESSSVYSSQLTINTAGPHTIKAIAVIQDKMNSSVTTDTFSIESCQTPDIAVDNSASNTATVTATAGSDESVTLFVNKGTPNEQSATGTGSASVTINKGTSSQTLPAEATASATRKLSATKTQNVTIEEKVAHVFRAHSLGGKALSANVPIKVTTTSDFQSQLATITEEDGVVWWEIDLQGHIWLSNNSRILYNVQAGGTSIFDSDGGANILTIEHIPEEVNEIRDNYVFNTCVNMTLFKTTGNTSLVSINSALRGLTNLKTVILPNSITGILFGAFQNDSELESVSAPSVTTIGQVGFSNCAKLVSLVLGTLTAIGQEAFYGCEALAFTGIDFSNVTSFGNSAFRGCTALESFTLRNVIKIPDYMFYGCTSLKTLDLPSDLEEIGIQAFMRGCTQLELVLPNTVTKIGSSATQFAGITAVIINSTVPPTLENNGLYGTFPIYVPDANVEDYKTAWSSLISRIKGISEKQ